MGHANFKTTKKTHATSAPEWLAVSAAVGRMVNAWAGRYDIAAFAGPGAGEGNPAFFNPRTSEVEINVERCFGAGTEPAEVASIDSRDTQYMWPRATGAIFHEALHAKYSKWDLDAAVTALTPAEFNAVVLFEEGRIERLGLMQHPDNSGFLRTMAVDVIVNDVDEIASSSDTIFASNVAALTLARVDAGSLDESDVAGVRDAIAAKLSDETLAKLRSIWLRAQAHTDHANAAPLYELAREWVRVVDEAAKENGDATSEESGSGGTGGPGELSEFGEALADALAEAADLAQIGAFGDLADAELKEDWEEQVKSKADKAKVQKDARDAASNVFGRSTTEVHGTSSASYLVEQRAPHGPERAAAVRIAQLLEKAKYRDRDETEVTSIVPPGRLRTRAAVQAAALKSKGVMAQSEPWRRTVRKHTEDPTLSIGVLVDISGSMGAAMVPMGVTAWVLSEAVRRVQGKAAMVYFGNDAFAMLKPGQHLDSVKIMSAPDSTEKFGKAFKSINGALNLTWGTGARLLVVVSDGRFTPQEQGEVKNALELCKSSGVAVLWLAFDGEHDMADLLTRHTDAVLCRIGIDAAAAATEIGTAAARALSAIG